MKILCDVCCKEEASAFCCADETALCEACDLRVHPANKLAGEHRRLSLSAPSTQSHPVCDICQENRGFLFCQEDRAILCRDCDVSVHSANHLTMKHNRFILTGVRLSAAPVSSSPSPVPEATATKAATKTIMTMNNQTTALVADVSSPMTFTSSSTTTVTSNISEYLIKMCPGWRVDDLLVDDEGGRAAAIRRDGSGQRPPGNSVGEVSYLGAPRAAVHSAGFPSRRRRLPCIERWQGGVSYLISHEGV